MANYPQMISSIIDQLQVDELLDYNCGEDMALMRALSPSKNVRYQAFDRDVPALSEAPTPSDMVVCLGVQSEADIRAICSLTERVLFAVVSSDRDISLWLPLFWEHMVIQAYQYVGNGEFYVIASPVSQNDH